MYKKMQSTGVTTDVRISDVLTIRTRNNVYEFFMIDPIRAYGLAKGGALGDCAIGAFICHPRKLQPGLKARLLIQTARGVRFITTSTIKAIEHLRAE